MIQVQIELFETDNPYPNQTLYLLNHPGQGEPLYNLDCPDQNWTLVGNKMILIQIQLWILDYPNPEWLFWVLVYGWSLPQD